MSVIDEVQALQAATLAEIDQAATSDALEAIRIKVVGKSGSLTGYLRSMGQVAPEERAQVGKTVNAARNEVEGALEAKKKELAGAELAARMEADAIDITLPGRVQQMGTRHLINRITDEIAEVFLGIGYLVATGPEVETDYYNFEALNAPGRSPLAQHARYLLRARSFGRYHECEGRIGRASANANLWRSGARYGRSGVAHLYHRAGQSVSPRCGGPSDLPQFNQIEGLVVDKGITFGDLKGTLDYFCKQMFGEERKTRFRAHYFPFTEPSAEVDVSCGICHGEGCRFCKGTGWLEILGCGMVDPNVLRYSGIDPEVYSGFAFGVGVERVACLKYNVPDLRMLLEGDHEVFEAILRTMLMLRLRLAHMLAAFALAPTYEVRSAAQHGDHAHETNPR